MKLFFFVLFIKVVMEQQLIKMKQSIKHMIKTTEMDIQLNRPRAIRDKGAAEWLRLLENESRFYKALDAHVTRGTVIDIAEMEEIKAVHIAVRSSERVYVQFCLSLGLDPVSVDSEGQTALHIACTKESLGNIKIPIHIFDFAEL
ncbi:uncharacterized protein LOC118179794 [Stegodyphus dumicola]|uniref:uncharacterized protein LOC118179794 n=1 Tax=Stegodyphus dumicola TaxID=202533 RepID=UPI0015A8A7E6|nr:uncharacterized protein LOC118179794 [Stegodyphus dumicola]